MSDVDELWLRPLRPEDEGVAHTAHDELALERFTFLLDRDRADGWSAYLRLLDRQRLGRDPREDRVPASFLVADVAGQLVGRVSIRHHLNDHLRHEGGHVGYGVRPAFRGRGYARRMLEIAVAYLVDVGERPVLIVCDEDNEGSRTLIEGCGGRFDDRRIASDGRPVCRYWLA